MGEALKTSPQKTIGEILNEACPYFMAIGVSYDEYWYKDPQRLKHYLKADEIRQKRKNNDLWIQGYYEYIYYNNAKFNNKEFYEWLERYNILVINYYEEDK